MNNTHRLVAVTIAFIGVCSARAAGPLDDLEQFDGRGGGRQVRALTIALDGALATPDAPTWHRLMALVEDGARPLQMRLGVLDVAGRHASEEQARDLARRASQWCDTYAAKVNALRNGDASAVTRATEPYLINYFVQRLGHEPWRSWTATESATILVLTRAAAGEVGMVDDLWPGDGVNPVSVLIDLPAPRKELQDAAAYVIAARPSNTAIDTRLAQLLDQASLGECRDRVAASVNDPLRFDWASATILAHVGDQETLPSLEAVGRKLDTIEVAGSPGAGAKLKLGVARLSEMIRMQQPPQRLIDFVESAAVWSPAETARRNWALGRAVELGLDRDRLRGAILHQADTLRAQFPAGTSQRASLELEMGLRSLDEVGHETGLLAPNESLLAGAESAR